jgi:hypothetical protein
MNPKTTSSKEKQCKGVIVEDGQVMCRWINEIVLHVKGKPPKRLQGDTLPAMLVLNTGKTHEAGGVLEFFSKETPRIPMASVRLRLDGRDVLVGVLTIVAFQTLMRVGAVVASVM